MKAVVYHGAKDIRLEEIDLPEIGPNDALVKIMSCGICGSDLHSYRQGVFSRPGWIMGHEMAGEVVEVGENVADIKVGERVIPLDRGVNGPPSCGECFWCIREMPQYCEKRKNGIKPCGKCQACLDGEWWLCEEMVRYMELGYGKYGGYAEYAPIWDVKLNTNVYKIPDNMTYEEGAAVEPLYGCLDWVNLADPKPYDTAVVLGLGTIGQLVMQALKSKVKRVIVSEVSEKRLAVAKSLGADVVINALKKDPIEKVIEQTGMGRSNSGRGGGCVDFVMECSGSDRALQQAVEMTRAGGRLILVGLFEKSVELDINKIIFKDLKLISSQRREKTVSPRLLILEAIDLIASGKVKIHPLISHEFSIYRIKEAFDTQANSSESVKVIVKP